MPAADTEEPTSAPPCAKGEHAPTPPQPACVSSTTLQHALTHAARGWPVFPLKANSKTPAFDRGHLEATTDPATIQAWWGCPMTGSPLPFNIGVRPVAGQWAVVDLDVKNGVDGPGNYEAAGGVVDGIVCATPSGGFHVYLAGPEIATTAGRIAPGVDSRSSDGFVVAPGSVIDGKEYELIADAAMLPIPAFVLDRAPARSERPSMVTTYTIDPDQPRNVERFAEACRRAQPAVAGIWHDASRDLACEAVRCAVSVEKALEVMLELWVPRGSSFFEDGRADRWPADVAASHDWALRQGEHGVNSVDAQLLAFEGVDIVLPPPDAAVVSPEPSAAGVAPRSRIRSFSPSECSLVQPAPYLVKGVLARGQVALVAALPASGKSCFVPLLAYKLAQGVAVFGRRTRPGPVAYFGLEDGNGMVGRIDAHRLTFGDAPAFRLHIDVGNLLTSPEACADVLRIVRADRPVLVVLDTVRAGWRGLAENDADAMGGVVAFARELARDTDGAPGPAVILVHHTTKAGGQTASGSGVLEADVDVSLFLTKDPDTNIVTVTFGKNRNGEAFGQQFCFGFEGVRIGTDEDGDPVTRPVAVEIDPATVKRTKAMSPGERKALAVLEGIVADGGPDVQMIPADMTFGGIICGEAASVPRDIWAAACEMTGLSSAAKSQDRARVFRQAVKDLLKHGVILQQGERILLLQPTDGADGCG